MLSLSTDTLDLDRGGGMFKRRIHMPSPATIVAMPTLARLTALARRTGGCAEPVVARGSSASAVPSQLADLKSDGESCNTCHKSIIDHRGGTPAANSARLRGRLMSQPRDSVARSSRFVLEADSGRSLAGDPFAACPPVTKAETAFRSAVVTLLLILLALSINSPANAKRHSMSSLHWPKPVHATQRADQLALISTRSSPRLLGSEAGLPSPPVGSSHRFRAGTGSM